MTRKRGAESELNRDNADDTNVDNNSNNSTWKRASDDELAKRKFVSVRRKKPQVSASATETNTPSIHTFPTFKLSQPNMKSCSTSKDSNEREDKVSSASKQETPTLSLLAQFAPKPGSWKCNTCLITNTPAAMKCVACESPAQSVETTDTATTATATTTATDNSAVNTTTFSFGVAEDDSTQLNPNAKPFTFGSKSSDSASTESTNSQISFGVAAGDSVVAAAETSNSFSFGSKSTTSLSSFSSFSQASSTTKSNSFTFGESAPSSTTFQFAPTTFSTTSNLDAATKTPMIAMPNEPIKNGEEDEKVMLKVPVTAYQIKLVEKINADGDSEQKQSYTECGTGDVHINSYTLNDAQKARLILRMDRTHRLALNVHVFKDMKFNIVSDRYVRFMTVVDGKFQTFLLKPKNKTHCVDIQNTLTKLQEAM